MSKYKFSEKNKAWSFYSKWRQEKTFCPALNSKIVISLKGWRHLIGTTGFKKRTFADVYRRLKLLLFCQKNSRYYCGR